MQTTGTEKGTRSLHQLCIRLYPSDVSAISFLINHCRHAAEFQGPVNAASVIRWALHEVATTIIAQHTGAINHGEREQTTERQAQTTDAAFSATDTDAANAGLIPE
jgi:hypothetical protein